MPYQLNTFFGEQLRQSGEQGDYRRLLICRFGMKDMACFISYAWSDYRRGRKIAPFTLFVVIRSTCSRVYKASILLKEDTIGPRFSNMEKRKERKRDADLCFLASAREQDSERGIPGAAGGISPDIAGAATTGLLVFNDPGDGSTAVDGRGERSLRRLVYRREFGGA